ncbi:MAG: hypothetical protein CM15mV122_090 [uncultured marine virus]|nr:MAG: hypothetical protein CM15mV122_090 [uncultured marine virus]
MKLEKGTSLKGKRLVKKEVFIFSDDEKVAFPWENTKGRWSTPCRSGRGV